MTPSLPDDLLRDDDRDLRLARRLDAGTPPDGTDALHEALDAVRPDPKVIEPDVSGRVWAGIDRHVRARTAPDRPAQRPARARVARWAVAAAAIVAVGAATWLTLRSDVVARAQGEVVAWTAPDGSTVTLRPNSDLVRLGARAYRIEGEAFFAVASDPGRPFTVQAGAASVRVLGTQFDVSTWGGQTDVFVEEGRVEVSASGEAVVLTPGAAVTATAAGVAAPVPAASESFLDWRTGRASFDGETVGRVAAEIGHHFDVSVSVPDDVARQSVSGMVELDSAPQALDGLGRILGGRFVPDDGGFRFVAR